VPENDPRSILYDISHNDLFVLDTVGNAVQLTGDSVFIPSLFMGYESPDVEYPSWSPDGRIAFSSGDTLWVVEHDGSGLHAVLIHEPAVNLHNVAWSPAGDAIAFSWSTLCFGSDCDPFHISVFDIKTGSLTLLTDPEMWSSSPSWSPDGSQLVYLSRPETGPLRINRMNNDGTGVTTLFEIPGNGNDLAWSPCGDQIAFTGTSSSEGPPLMLVQTDGSNLRQLTVGEQASWSPDCSRLAFIKECVDECDSFAVDVWMIGADGSGERKVTRRD
jgi:Tol biopolymer transport system component